MRHLQAISLVGALMLVGCDTSEKVAPTAALEPIGDTALDELIEKKLLRIDINFTQVRRSPEFKDDEYVDWSDSHIVCVMDLHNFSEKDVVLEREMFTHYGWIEILRQSDGEQAAMLSPNPPRGVSTPVYFTIEAGDTHSFNVQYEAFECFHGFGAEESVVYGFPGDFVIFHEQFPEDRLEFSVNEAGIVRPRFDMKIQDGVTPKPEQDAADQLPARGESKTE